MVNLLLSVESNLVTFLTYIIIAQALLSWFLPQFSGKKYMIFLREISDPILMPIRNVIPPLGMMDLSPIIAIIALQLLIGPIIENLTLRLA